MEEAKETLSLPIPERGGREPRLQKP